MSIHLVGGGRAVEYAERVYGPFVREAVQRARSADRDPARIGVLQLFENDPAEGTEQFQRFAETLVQLGPCEPVALLIREGDELAAASLADLDGLLVAGGLTPAYLTAVRAVRAEIRALVDDGVPYLGFSAGAAIAADRAIVGGWKIADLVVCHEDNGEELDELTVADGLGLVDFSVDVHAAQWGNLGRVMMAVADKHVDRAVALDEGTLWIVGQDAHQVRGAGQAWWVERSGGGLSVRTEREQTAG